MVNAPPEPFPLHASYCSALHKRNTHRPAPPPPPPICKELSRRSASLSVLHGLSRGRVVDSFPGAQQLISLISLSLKIFWIKQKGILCTVEAKSIISGKLASQSSWSFSNASSIMKAYYKIPNKTHSAVN